MKAVAIGTARSGGEASYPAEASASPGALAPIRLPALRLFAALVFLIPGGLLLLAGLALLLPWLRRLPAVLDQRTNHPGMGVQCSESRQPYGSEPGEPSEHGGTVH